VESLQRQTDAENSVGKAFSERQNALMTAPERTYSSIITKGND
jgi:hypothetical protein